MSAIVSKIVNHLSNLKPIKVSSFLNGVERTEERGTFLINDKKVKGYIVWENKASYDSCWLIPESKNRFVHLLKEGWDEDKDDFAILTLRSFPMSLKKTMEAELEVMPLMNMTTKLMNMMILKAMASKKLSACTHMAEHLTIFVSDLKSNMTYISQKTQITNGK